MKKKILFVLPCFEFGGTVFSTLNMVSLLKDEYDIHILPLAAYGPIKEQYDKKLLIVGNAFLDAIFTPGKQNKLTPKQIFYKALYRCSLFLRIPIVPILYRNTAKRLQNKYSFDFVASCQEGDTTEFVSYFPKAKKIAWFRSEYSVYRQHHTASYEAKLKSVYSRIDNIVCVSNTTRDDFAKWFPECENKAIAIHNIQNVKAIVERSKEKVSDPIDSNVFTIVSVGRFSPQKRFSSIPSLASSLRDAGLKFKWYIIGEGNIEGEMDKLTANQEKYGTQDVILPIGSRTNPYPYIASSDLFVITSSYEACPRVVAEAHILGKPVISADYSSAREFVKDGENGFVDTLDNLPGRILEVANNRSLYEKMVDYCSTNKMDTRSIFGQLKSLFS